MTIFGRFVRRQIERWLDRWKEGPVPPKRLGLVVEDFARRYPKATKREWIAFAQRWSAECYRTGWQRGYENVERTWPGPPIEPEQLVKDYDFSWYDMAPALADLDGPVTDETTFTPEERMRQLAAVGRSMGGFKVEVVPVARDLKRR